MTNSQKNILALLLILVMGALLYLPRLATLPYRGEEPRRVISAYEMWQADQWIVPTIQHQPFLSRPPLQNWVIAATADLLGNFDHLSGRLPSAICALLTAVLIYMYCNALMSRPIALLAALFFLTMPQVLQLGRTAETELMFTFLFSSAILLWHWGEIKRWPNSIKWLVAYGFLACATLTKGINQAPLFFAVIVSAYLFITQRSKNLLTKGHCLGVMLLLGLVGLWQMKFIQAVGTQTGWAMHTGDILLRFDTLHFKDYIKHGLIFPFELLAVMLPWSLWLFAYGHRSIWQHLSPHTKPIVIFCFTAIAITIFFVWFPPGSHTRYYLPLFPCFAILAAIGAVESLQQKWTKVHLKIQQVCQILIPLCGLGYVLFAAYSDQNLSSLHALIYCGSCFGIGGALWYFAQKSREQSFSILIILYSLFIALSFNVVYTDTRQAVYNNMKPQVFETLSNLPKGTQLVSIGPIAFDFLYYYLLYTGETIPISSVSALQNKHNPSIYFCANTDQPLPFLWNTIQTIPAGRYKSQYTHRKQNNVVIGKLLTYRD